MVGAAVLAAAPAVAAAATGAAPPTQPCRVAGLVHEVQCGSVQRALDPARPDGPHIEVHYVRVPAMARRKLPDPVFMLAGGPGQSATALAPAVMPLYARLNNRRDIVFVDQRGTGRSAPLDCPEDTERSLGAQPDPDRQVSLLHACRDALGALPYVQAVPNLRFFTTTLAMGDVDAVRRQLGAERINLVGGSYGTRAALEMLRLYPRTVRRAVLDGVAPPDMVLPASMSADSQAALDAVFTHCEQQPDCSRRHPSLRAEWRNLLKNLPREVAAPNPTSGAPERYTLTREALLQAVRGPLYAPAIAAALPAAIDEAAHGRWQGIAGLAGLLNGRRGSGDLALGMHFSVVCAEDLPRLGASREVPGVDFGSSFASLYRQICQGWPRGEVADDFYRIAPVATPVLLLSGGLDPVTPPRHGERVAAALGPSARHVVVPNAGHGVLSIGCMQDVLYRFIDAADDAEAQAVDAGCAQAIPRPPAYEPPRAEARP